MTKFGVLVVLFVARASPLLAHGTEADDHVQGYILGPRDGAVAMSHTIKADPALGSNRLGLGTQTLKSGRGIEFHSHDIEDEILYVVRGRGIGAVGTTRAQLVPGSVLYAPAGAWHAISAEEEMDIMWISSPPHFSRASAFASDGRRAVEFYDPSQDALGFVGRWRPRKADGPQDVVIHYDPSAPQVLEIAWGKALEHSTTLRRQ